MVCTLWGGRLFILASSCDTSIHGGNMFVCRRVHCVGPWKVCWVAARAFVVRVGGGMVWRSEYKCMSES